MASPDVAETERLLVETFLRRHPVSSARTLERFDPADAAAALDHVDAGDAAGVLGRMAPSQAAASLDALDEPGPVLSRMEEDAAAVLLRRLPEERWRRLLGLVRPEVAALLGRVLAFPEGTAGAIADPTVLALPVDVSAEEASERVRRSAETVMYYLYVVDRAGVLVGVLSLRELMLADPRDRVETLMRGSPARLRASAGRVEVVEHPGWLEFHALPVVDGQGRFVGVVRYETLRMLAREAEGSPAAGLTSTALALGELYWVGLTGVIEGLGRAAVRGTEPDE